MKLTIKQSNLNKALSSILRLVTTKTTLPILSSVLIAVKNNKITITATNLEQAITIEHVGKIDQEGSVSVPARILSDLVSTLPQNESITLEEKDTHLLVSSGRTNAKINLTKKEEFPEIPTIKSTNQTTIDAKSLKQALSQTLFSVSKDESRQVLNGVLFNFYEGKLLLASTDSYRLSEKELAAADEQDNFIIPTEALTDLNKILEDGEVVIIQEETQVKITYKETQIISRLISGEYPNYKQLIPQKENQEIVLNKSELLSALKTISVFARESAGGVKLTVDQQNQTIEISSIATQVGENTAQVDAQITGEGEQTINSRYLIDALNAIEDKDEITMFFNDKLSPLVLSSKDGKHTQLIMPLKS